MYLTLKIKSKLTFKINAVLVLMGTLILIQNFTMIFPQILATSRLNYHKVRRHIMDVFVNMLCIISIYLIRAKIMIFVQTFSPHCLPFFFFLSVFGEYL